MNKYIFYKSNLIEALFDLSDYETQRDLWFEQKNNRYSSYVEDVEAVFLDTALEKALYDGNIIFDHVTDDALRDLYQEVERVGYDRSEEELIDSSEMDIIRAKAAKALALVKTSDASESTVEIHEFPG